jgi:hypothetical protein
LLNALDSKEIVGDIFCDLTKAFDCVDHDLLISKIEKYGITSKSKELIESYIKDKYQRVLINDKTNHKTTISKWAINKHGVPQGSVLPSTMFLLYINDLPAVINKKATPVFFADGTSITCTHHNAVDFHMNSEIVLKM